MDRDTDLRIEVLKWFLQNPPINNSLQSVRNFHYKDFTRNEIEVCIEELINQGLADGRVAEGYYVGRITYLGKEHLEMLLKIEENKTFWGIIKTHWFAAIMLLLAFLAALYGMMDFYKR